jgi:GPH family glycoside/pentoside/hexuronide:cation symporter
LSSQNQSEPNEEAIIEKLNVPQGIQVAYATGTFADNLALQNFSFLGFSFYFAVIGLPAPLITVAYVIYSIWDAFDDPILGMLSDRTRTKWGRRKPWIMAATIPLCILMVVLWTPPQGSYVQTIVYLIIILFLFDAFFTMYTVSFNSLWPEMFLTVKDRSSIGVWRNIFTILALLVAYLVPGFIIEDMTNIHGYSYTKDQFVINGAISAALVFITIIIMFKWGSFERKEFSKDSQHALSFIESFKLTIKNKAFVYYAITALAVFIVYGILPILLPFYAVQVLHMGSTDSIEVSLLIFLGLLVGAASTPLWMKLRQKYGVRRTYMIALAYWAITLIGLMFATNAMQGYIVMFFMGFGLGGSLYLYDQGIAEICDDDEVRSGKGIRREGAFYGVIAFFNRFSNGINIIVISIVFTGTGWGSYTPRPGANVLLGLRGLLGIWPVIIIAIAIIFLYKWPINNQRLQENKRLLAELHTKKKANL